MGCPEGAKASVDVTHLPLAVSAGAQVISRARVARVTLDERGRANGAVYLREGREHFQAASVVVMAAGGIGTPRVLRCPPRAGSPTASRTSRVWSASG
jgi:choline dehydrogenase-like flavoprotein